jgi:hypothetical protein
LCATHEKISQSAWQIFKKILFQKVTEHSPIHWMIRRALHASISKLIIRLEDAMVTKPW